jgi:hypothetical protein
MPGARPGTSAGATGAPAGGERLVVGVGVPLGVDDGLGLPDDESDSDGDGLAEPLADGVAEIVGDGEVVGSGTVGTGKATTGIPFTAAFI